MTVPHARIGGAWVLLLAVCLLAAGDARADKPRVCFIGPVFLAGVSDDACVADEKERKRLVNLAVVDAARKPIALLMQAEGKSKRKMTVATCRRWTQAVSLSSSKMVAQDKVRGSYYERTCPLLEQLKFADPARKALLTAKGRDLARSDRVPAQVLRLTGVKGPQPLPGATLDDLYQAGELVIRNRKRAMVDMRWRSVDVLLNPVARGDFDRDGVEDLAATMEVVSHNSARRNIVLMFLTRRKAKGALEIVYPKARGVAP